MIIAEIGQNHCGNMDLAKTLIKLAEVNGADLVKFQLYDHHKLYGDKLPDVSLSFEQAKDLFDFGASQGAEVFFSVFDVERVKWCEEIGVKWYKLAFSQRNNTELHMTIPFEKQLIISSNEDDTGDYSLYCVPHYPTKLEELKFSRINFPDKFQGFSDHTIGLDAAKIALARGAQIIEKHFALDHKTGIDAPWSMTPNELKELKTWESICQSVL